MDQENSSEEIQTLPKWLLAVCAAGIVAVTFSIAVLEGANAADKTAAAQTAAQIAGR